MSLNFFSTLAMLAMSCDSRGFQKRWLTYKVQVKQYTFFQNERPILFWILVGTQWCCCCSYATKQKEGLTDVSQQYTIVHSKRTIRIFSQMHGEIFSCKYRSVSVAYLYEKIECIETLYDNYYRLKTSATSKNLITFFYLVHTHYT